MRNAIKESVMNCLVLSVLICASTGCRPAMIANNYYVDTIDTEDDRSLYYKLANGYAIGRVEPCVVAIGWNDKHIIVKRRIRKETTICYYILEIEKDSAYANPCDVVVGPLQENEFLEKRRQLNVSSNLTFSTTY